MEVRKINSISYMPKKYLYVIISLLLPVQALALEFEHILSLPMTVEYQSNPTFVEAASDETPVTRRIIVPTYSILAEDEVNSFRADFAYSVERSSDKEIIADRDDPRSGLTWERTLENGRLSVAGHVENRSTRETEYEDSGLIAVDGTRKQKSSSVLWENNISERASFTISGEYNRISYDNIALFDYTARTAILRLDYQASDTLEPFFNLSKTETRELDTGIQYELTRAGLGLHWIASESTEWIVSASATKEKDSSTVKDKDGYISVIYESERVNASLSIMRSIAPSGTAGFIRSNQLNASWRYALEEGSSFGINFNYRENLDEDEGKTATARLNYNNELTEQWRTDLSVERRAREAGPFKAFNNIARVTLVYSL